ncbi:amidohydrolase [Mycolicibacter heraklionensis]|uniref:Amidohydrolase n=1 Tax=Mycolicibacter heraklionensis TaxID=512402 RepID=A0ABR5FK02_9MYCO|nr:amidohydrolase family protein [Mycolicibacter heraklionensis]KLO31359.1 amidohydrolase [Mycolicibacter heraklionensis]
MKTALRNVRVFDGSALTEPVTVVIDDAVIGSDAAGAEIVDGAGGVLLPGLIDAHIHLHDIETLQRMCAYGVTTALDMATWPSARVDGLRHQHGCTDIRSAGTPATTSGSTHSHIPGFPAAGFVDTPDAAAQFVAERIDAGSDYIKIIADSPGPDQSTMDALVIAAHDRGKQTIVHATATPTFAMAVTAGADMITHVPLDHPLDASIIGRMAAAGTLAIPTLTMMEGIAAKIGAVAGLDYAAARSSVTAMYEAGIPILAGTDANATPGVPFSPRHGESLHHELELLVDSGLSTTDALRAATSLPARCFGLSDRGVVAPGYRADLILLDGDPLADIRATRNIRRVWCAGMQTTPDGRLT